MPYGSALELVERDSSILLQRVARHVQGAIAKGHFGPGERLPGERTLAQQLGVSRNTVSAAYQRLEDLGLLRRVAHHGAFVRRVAPLSEPLTWSKKVSSRAHGLDEPVLEMLANGTAPNAAYPLSAGTPALCCFPLEVYQAAISRVLTDRPYTALAIASTEGQPLLRRALAEMEGVEPNRILITSGAQEGIDLVARCLIQPGDVAVVDRPTFPGAIQSLRAAGAELVEWNVDRWSADELESLLITHRPKLIFTMPTYHNPTGRIMSAGQRAALLDLASRYQVAVIEDDVYSRTQLEGTLPPSLLAMDRFKCVIYLSTFSKMLAPGLRLGWTIAPPYMVKQLALIKMRANLFTEGLQQLVFAEMIANGSLARHLLALREHHLELRDTLSTALAENFPGRTLTWNTPSGGLYFWCRAAAVPDMEARLLTAQERGVGVAPGRAFFANAPDEEFFRICFSALPSTRLVRAVQILARALKLGVAREA